MSLNYPPAIVLISHFRISGGHDLNPSGQILIGEDQQLFATFNQIAMQVMSAAGLGPNLLPLVVALASMAPGVSPIQRVQLATLFVKNAIAALNKPAANLAQLMLPSKQAAAAPSGSRARARTRRSQAGRRGRSTHSRG